MGSVSMRISRIFDNLKVIQSEVSILAGHELETIHDEQLGPPDVQALRRVKCSVDHLRQVLRTYIDYASSQVGAPDSEEFQRVRSERTTQILRYACEGLQLRELKNHEVPASLFDQLIEMAVTTVDRYQVREEAREAEILQAIAD